MKRIAVVKFKVVDAFNGREISRHASQSSAQKAADRLNRNRRTYGYIGTYAVAPVSSVWRWDPRKGQYAWVTPSPDTERRVCVCCGKSHDEPVRTEGFALCPECLSQYAKFERELALP